jgi:tRNA modification GTPase
MRLHDQRGDHLDSALVLTFEEGKSFTGERVCEFQIHGSIAVITAVIAAILEVPGVRAAEPGEFTQRAFLAGRMDLTEVEALADLIDAETDAQRRQAMRVLDGSAARLLEDWRNDLLQALAMIEASLDFADEELPDDLTSHVLEPIRRVTNSVKQQLSGRRAAETIRDGFEVAIIGRVNAGKSSFLNALAGREAAITSEREGTTRDVIEVRMDIAGLPVTLIDTAGLRETEDDVERIGIERGRARASTADLRVYLKSTPEEIPSGVRAGDIVVLSKADIWGLPGLSSKTGEGFEGVLDRIEESLSSRTKESAVFCRQRHFDKLVKAREALETAEVALESQGAGWEMVSADVQSAVRSLDGIIGRVDVEDILGRIFSSFCIGK